MQGTVLIIDDDIDMAAFLVEMLRRRGFDASAVHSARACLRHLERHGCDVVVTDIKMDQMSGIELCERLRLQHPHLLTIMVTG